MRKMLMLLLVLALAGMCQENPKPAAAQEGKSYVRVKNGEDQQDVLLQDVAAFLEKADHFYLATCEGDGARVRPIKYTYVLDNKLLFVTSSKKEVYGQLIKNPKVEVSQTAADKSAYLRYKGLAAPCTDEAVKAKVLEAFPNFQKSFKENLVIFWIEPEMVGLFPMKGGQAKTKTFTK